MCIFVFGRDGERWERVRARGISSHSRLILPRCDVPLILIFSPQMRAILSITLHFNFSPLNISFLWYLQLPDSRGLQIAAVYVPLGALWFSRKSSSENKHCPHASKSSIFILSYPLFIVKLSADSWWTQQGQWFFYIFKHFFSFKNAWWFCHIFIAHATCELEDISMKHVETAWVSVTVWMCTDC